jgi:hypothetical protein
MSETTERLRKEFEQRSTTDLISILRARDEEEWRAEVFEVVAGVLKDRGVSPDDVTVTGPQRHGVVAKDPTAAEGRPPRRGRRSCLVAVAVAVASLVGTCMALPYLFRSGKSRKKAELASFVADHRQTLDELLSLARGERKPRVVARDDDSMEGRKYRAILERLGVPGPLEIQPEPLRVSVTLYRNMRTVHQLVHEPPPGELVDDLERAHDARPGGGVAYMRISDDWCVRASWD